MTTPFIGNDLVLEHNYEYNTGCIFVSFSAWNPKGIGTPFGLNFFSKNNIETFFITQKKANQWWHTPDLAEIARIVYQRKTESGKKVVLYGSSMGAYASCHFRNMFRADTALAIAPQIFVDKTILPIETRWERDINEVQKHILFDEVINIKSQVGELFVFFDPLHSLDNAHIQHLLDVGAAYDSVTLIEVPYSNHDVARLLSQTKLLQRIVQSVNEEGVLDHSLKALCKESYLHDHKSFFNYFRNTSFQNNVDLLHSLKEKLLSYLTSSKDMDFEALYMASECLSKIGMSDRAVELIEQSITLYQTKYDKSPPHYLCLKRDNIYKKANINID